jgi:hypothetical protein
MKPTFAPDVINIKLFGPGVKVETKANITSAVSCSSSMMFPSKIYAIKLCRSTCLDRSEIILSGLVRNCVLLFDNERLVAQ